MHYPLFYYFLHAHVFFCIVSMVRRSVAHPDGARMDGCPAPSALRMSRVKRCRTKKRRKRTRRTCVWMNTTVTRTAGTTPSSLVIIYIIVCINILEYILIQPIFEYLKLLYYNIFISIFHFNINIFSFSAFVLGVSHCN